MQAKTELTHQKRIPLDNVRADDLRVRMRWQRAAWTSGVKLAAGARSLGRWSLGMGMMKLGAAAAMGDVDGVRLED